MASKSGKSFTQYLKYRRQKFKITLGIIEEVLEVNDERSIKSNKKQG